ncbi:MAG: anion permease [Chloroflexi bacterium]|nr:anion permease [Chloroflexota bacterium]
MDWEQLMVFGVLIGALVLFVWGRWRYDLVAGMALLTLVIVGVIKAEDAFSGFGEPAVITVAAVLVISRGLQNAGLVDMVSRWVMAPAGHTIVQIGVLTLVAAFLSAFMNNIGALAFLMPVAVRISARNNIPLSHLLMPLSFASLLGGMTTLIGTPPNILIANFRAQNGGEAFGMFAFAPVGVAVALAGLVFVSLIGWRLIPMRRRQASAQERFHMEEYITEVRVPEDSEWGGKTVQEVEAAVEGEVQVLALVRGQERVPVFSSYGSVRPQDVLLMKAGPETLEQFLEKTKMELAASKELGVESLESDSVGLVEAVVMPDSLMIGRTAVDLRLRAWYGVNLLAVARKGAVLRERLGRIRFQASDILLFQGRTETLPETLASLGCLPLSERELRLGQPRRVAQAVGVFAAAIALAASGVLSAPVALVLAAAVMLLLRVLTLREAYASIDWPIIVLLGALIPVGRALQDTGGAQLIAEGILRMGTGLPPEAALVIVLIAAMVLSDVLNNAATAVLMAPIALGVASGLEVSADPFLMAVAVGASCAFLSPVGHQSNMLVMGPGGYRFGDYWRMGLPLEVIVVAVALPVLLVVWPLTPGG